MKDKAPAKQPLLSGDLINLRPLKRADAESLHRYANNSVIARYLPRMPHPYSLEDAHKWIRHTRRKVRKREAYSFGMENRETGGIIGMTSLDNLRWDDLNAELGYWVARPFWRKGFATEAVMLILEFAFGTLGLKRVWALVIEPNEVSSHVLQKAGFTLEGTWRKARRHGRKWVDIYSYGILREEFTRRNRN